MTGLVFEYQGTLDKYIGDAVMAFWGAPFEVDDHATSACNSALKMMERVREMQREEREVVWLVVDASVELWAGGKGDAPLDHVRRDVHL